MFSAICGSESIDDTEINFDAENSDDDMEVDTASVNSEILSIIEGSEDLRPRSRSSSRPNSSLNFSIESQDVRLYFILSKIYKLINLKWN